jgi:hypothetical protein
MSDSMSPDSKKRIPDEEGPQREPTPTTGIVHEDLGDPERGMGDASQSLSGEPGQKTPEHVHQRRLRESGSAMPPEDGGDAPPEIAGDDQSLLTGNPPGGKPM